MRRRNLLAVGSLAAVIAMVVGDRLSPSVPARMLHYSGEAYIWLGIALTVRAGYRRRRPYWTRESWHRYLRACAIPFGALVFGFGMLAAQDYHLLVIGPARSALRFTWISALLVLMFGGVWKLANALSWLTDGDPTQQFTRVSKRQGRTEGST